MLSMRRLALRFQTSVAHGSHFVMVSMDLKAPESQQQDLRGPMTGVPFLNTAS